MTGLSRPLSVLLLTAASVSTGAWAVDYEPMIEISGGYEYVSSPGTEGQDDSRSGGRVIVSLEALRLNFHEPESADGAILSFLPLIVEAEPSIDNMHGDGFGGIENEGTFKHPVRRIVGALIDARYDFLDGRMLVRGKLASAEYDRDRGFWDWRAVDAEVGVHHVWEPKGGDVIVDLELRAGVAAGGLHINDLGQLQASLRNATGAPDAAILTPHATASAGLDFDSLKVKWTGGVEQRFDLTSPSGGPDMDSTRFVTSLEASYRVSPGGFANEFEVFAGARYELDTLTAGNMFFGSGDLFHAVLIQAGIRGRF